MAQLDSMRSKGWSYAAGWSQELRSHLARAWRPRKKPLLTSEGAILVMHSVSATADNLESAAIECSNMAASRDSNEEGYLSEFEQRYIRSQNRKN